MRVLLSLPKYEKADILKFSMEKELLMTKHDLELKGAELKTALRDLEDARSQIADVTASLDEAKKNMGYLSENERRLEKELAQS